MTEKYLDLLRNSVNKELGKCLPSENTEPKIIHRAMRYSVFSGGKRLRPILAIESCVICGGKKKEVLPAAAAIELIHTYSLIHDDLPAMDDDDYRRGKPACHKRFGEANAILAGDALLTLAFNVVSFRMRQALAPKIAKELADATGSRGMVGGQVMDLEWHGAFKGKGLSNRINRLKTASLFEASTKIGAMVASADRERIIKMAKFGVALGMAFQRVDDILDGESRAAIPRDIIEAAKRELKIFGKRADNLKMIADHVLNRLK